MTICWTDVITDDSPNGHKPLIHAQLLPPSQHIVEERLKCRQSIIADDEIIVYIYSDSCNY